MTTDTPAPAEALKPGTPEFLLASVANRVEILCDERAEAEDKSWYAGPDCVPDLIRLSDHLRDALARVEAAEAERDRLLAGLEKLTAGWSELTGVGVCYAAEEVREVVRQAVGAKEASHE